MTITRKDLSDFIAENNTLLNQAMDAIDTMCDMASRIPEINDDEPVAAFNALAELAVWAKATTSHR